MPRWRLELVKFLRHVDDDAFWIICWNTICDDYDVEGLDVVEIRLLGFTLPEIWLQDCVEAGTSWSSTAGPYCVEDSLYVDGSRDVLVAVVVFGVQEVNVNTVFIVLGTDRGYGCQRGAGLAP